MAADNIEEPEKTSRRRRLFSRPADTIAGQVGDNARGVVIGKNVIQIGRVNVPVWLVFAFGSILVAAFGLLLFVNADELADRLGLIPVEFPLGVYGVAVAPFHDPSAVDAETRNEGIDKATSLTRYLSYVEETFSNIGEAPKVFGPEEKIQPTSIAAVTEYAAKLKADIVIYGVLKRVSAQRWELTPRFYVSEAALKRAPELSGDAALGAPITYRIDAPQASQREVNFSLQQRVKTIIEISMALSYLEQDSLDGYRDAVALLDALEMNSAWVEENVKLPGQEIFYTYRGFAYLKLADAISELDQGDAAALAAHLEKAELLLLKGEEINPSSPRVLVALGSIYFQKGRRLRALDCSLATMPYLEKAKGRFEAGIESLSGAPDISSMPLGDRSVYLNALLGLGRVDFYRYYCDGFARGHPRLVKDALINYDAVIADYNRAPDPLLARTALYAYLETAQLLRDALAGLAALPFSEQPGNQIVQRLRQADALARELDRDGLSRDVQAANDRVCANLAALLPIAPELAAVSTYCESLTLPTES